ncbi:hypothetical protein Y032_0141g2264 [Ancylostoma ceylanicum]|uniref:Uncharacterized protein n=1 Tax=Ancylostoma ceylanicum TaxID=53326 RepID=A0A016T3X3_9BILA|nr:hypothetical protein Y032_0141g2264 [Ancylostoma ceylanicum]
MFIFVLSTLSDRSLRSFGRFREIRTLNYYSHPDYGLLHQYLMDIMKAGKFKFTDPYDWERKLDKQRTLNTATTTTVTVPITTIKKDLTQPSCSMNVPLPATGKAKSKISLIKATAENPFPVEWFRTNPLGF